MAGSSSEDELMPYDPEAPLDSLKSYNIFQYRDPALINSLMSAVLVNNVDEIKKYLANGWNPNNVDNNGNTSLHLAMHTRNLNTIQLILEVDGMRIDSQNHLGQTPLVLALKDNLEDEIIIMLLAHGCDIHIGNLENITPLHLSVGRKTTIITEILIEMGADVNAVDHNNFTPLKEAIFNCRLDQVGLLLVCDKVDKSNLGEHDLEMALRRNCCEETLKQLLLFITDHRSVIYLLVEYNKPKMLKWYFEENPNLDIHEILYHKDFLAHVEIRIEWFCLIDFIFQKSFEYFNTIWSKIRVFDSFVENTSTLKNLCRNCAYNNEDWYYVWYTILSSKGARKILFHSRSFIHKIFYCISKRNLHEDDVLKLLYTILSKIERPLHYREVAPFLEKYKSGPLFDIFLSINPTIVSFNPRDCRTTYFLKLLIFKSKPSFASLNQKYENGKIYYPYVPSLAELSRNAVHSKYLTDHSYSFPTVGSFDYIIKLRSLNLPSPVFEILMFHR